MVGALRALHQDAMLAAKCWRHGANKKKNALGCLTSASHLAQCPLPQVVWKRAMVGIFLSDSQRAGNLGPFRCDSQ